MSEYTKGGGKWLGAARSWVQHHCLNGDTVTWGSNTELRPPLTIRHVEELAADVADAANSEADEMRKQVDELRRKLLKAEIELDYLRKDKMK